jgi:hypothetical protein
VWWDYPVSSPVKKYPCIDGAFKIGGTNFGLPGFLTCEKVSMYIVVYYKSRK